MKGLWTLMMQLPICWYFRNSLMEVFPREEPERRPTLSGVLGLKKFLLGHSIVWYHVSIGEKFAVVKVVVKQLTCQQLATSWSLCFLFTVLFTLPWHLVHLCSPFNKKVNQSGSLGSLESLPSVRQPFHYVISLAQSLTRQFKPLTPVCKVLWDDTNLCVKVHQSWTQNVTIFKFWCDDPDIQTRSKRRVPRGQGEAIFMMLNVVLSSLTVLQMRKRWIRCLKWTSSGWFSFWGFGTI